jgi:hypothetical protein
MEDDLIYFKKEDDLKKIYTIKIIKSKIEDDLNHFLKKEDDLNFLKMEDDLKKIM